jgi:hypothetical protein
MIARRSVVGLKLTRKRFFRRTGLSPREHRPRDYGNTEPLVKIRHWALKQRTFIHLSDFQAALRAQSLFPCKSDEPSISQGRTKNEMVSACLKLVPEWARNLLTLGGWCSDRQIRARLNLGRSGILPKP